MTLSQKNENFAILVLSCDKYSDLWDGFFKCFFKNFPSGSNYKIYLGSNTKIFEHPQVLSILSGHDDDWSSSYIRILRQIPEVKILVLLEDIFISSPINIAKLNIALDFAITNDVNYLRFFANPTPDIPTLNPLIGEIIPGAPYRTTVCGLWNKHTLLSILLPGESPWDFEVFGSHRSKYFNKFFSTWNPLIEYKNLIEKGGWIMPSVKWALDQGIKLDMTAHTSPNINKIILSKIKITYFNFIKIVPWKIRLKVVNLLRKALISY